MHELGRIGACENDEPALGGEGAQHEVDLALGLDIDAARRIVEQQHGRVERQPLGERHLLLVAARKSLHRAGDVALDGEPAGEIGDQPGFRGPVAQAPARKPAEGGQDEVGGDGMRQHQPLVLAVGRHIDDAGRIGRLDMGGQAVPARDLGPVGPCGNCAVKAEQQVFLPLPDKAADTDDLARMGGKADVAHEAGGKALDADAQRAGSGSGARREEIARLAADHQAHQPLPVDAGERLVGGDAAVLQHGDMGAERLHLVEAVGDIEQRRAAVAQRLDEAGEDAGLMGGERGGRLVKDEHAGLTEERLGDLHHLAAAEREVGDRHVERLGEAHHVADLPHAAMERGIVDEAEAAREGTEADILGDRQVVRQTQLLLHHGDAGRTGGGRAEAPDRLAVDGNRAAVRLESAGQQVDQRGFSRAVLAEQGMNPARQKGDIDALENGIAEKSLEHLPGFQQGPWFRHDGVLFGFTARSACRTTPGRSPNRCSRRPGTGRRGRGSCRSSCRR